MRNSEFEIEKGIKKKRKSPEILVEEIKRKSEEFGETICAKRNERR